MHSSLTLAILDILSVMLLIQPGTVHIFFHSNCAATIMTVASMSNKNQQKDKSIKLLVYLIRALLFCLIPYMSVSFYWCTSSIYVN